MVFDDINYSVIVVSSSDKFNESLKPLLPESTYYPVHFVSSIASAKRAILQQEYDFVIVNTPLTDDFGTSFAIDISVNKSMLCLLIIKADLYEEIFSKVVNHGVYTLPKPTSANMISQALRWLAASRAKLGKLQKKNISIEEKMEEIRLVNRAKWLLIENLKMTEADAHRYIEKQAMDLCEPKRQIAKNIIKTYT